MVECQENVGLFIKLFTSTTTKNACGNNSVSMQGFSKQGNTKEWTSQMI